MSPIYESCLLVILASNVTLTFLFCLSTLFVVPVPYQRHPFFFFGCNVPLLWRRLLSSLANLSCPPPPFLAQPLPCYRCLLAFSPRSLLLLVFFLVSHINMYTYSQHPAVYAVVTRGQGGGLNNRMRPLSLDNCVRPGSGVSDATLCTGTVHT